MADKKDTPAVSSLSKRRQSSISNRDHFEEYIRQQSGQLREQISRLHEFSLVGGERQDAIEHVLGGITELSNYIADANQQITAHDRRIYSETIKNLEDELKEVQSQIAPNAKFQFKSRFISDLPQGSNSPEDSSATEVTIKSETGLEGPGPEDSSQYPSRLSSCTVANPDEIDEVSNLPLIQKNENAEVSKASRGTRKPSFYKPFKVELSDHSDMHIIMPPSASIASSAGSLSRLKGCIVDMSIPITRETQIATLNLREIKGCLIIAGRVSGAAHVTKSEESVIAVAAGQLRIHDCKDLKLYVWCSSRPIIENSTRIQFAPLPDYYTLPSKEFSTNHWDQVDDFNWHKTDQHSPNWRIIPEEERLPNRIWEQVVPGERGSGLSDILKEVELKGGEH